MIRLAEAMGRPVVARDTAETIGQVHGAIIDVASRRIVAVAVGKGHKARLVDWASITGLGPDAVVVESETSLRAPKGDREQGMVKGDITLLGALVLTDRGDALGTLTDVELDEGTGEILALVSGETMVPASQLRSVGSYAVVVGTPAPTAGTG